MIKVFINPIEVKLIAPTNEYDIPEHNHRDIVDLDGHKLGKLSMEVRDIFARVCIRIEDHILCSDDINDLISLGTFGIRPENKSVKDWHIEQSPIVILELTKFLLGKFNMVLSDEYWIKND